MPRADLNAGVKMRTETNINRQHAREVKARKLADELIKRDGHRQARALALKLKPQAWINISDDLGLASPPSLLTLVRVLDILDNERDLPDTDGPTEGYESIDELREPS